MTFNPDRHHRRSNRLRGYDYARAGAYFVTICTQDRKQMFGDVINDEMVLNDAGSMIAQVWSAIPTHYPAVDVDAFVVMPNHVHGIIVLNPYDAGSGQPQGIAPTDGHAMSLADAVHRFKTMTTKRYTDGVKQSGWPTFRGRLWQRNYYEHIIRNDEELNRIRQYIADNPKNWTHDRDNPDCIEATAPTPWEKE